MIWLPFRAYPRTAACLRNEELEENWEELRELTYLLVGDHPTSSQFTLAWHRNVGSALVLLLALSGEMRKRGLDGAQAGENGRGVALYVKRCSQAARAGSALAPVPPVWLGQPALHLSHQSVLIRKDPGHYASLFPHAPLEMPLLWPVDCEGSALEIFTDADWGQFLAGRLVIPEDLREGVELDE